MKIKYNFSMFLNVLKIIGMVAGGLFALLMAYETVFWLLFSVIALTIDKKKEYTTLNKFYNWWMLAFYKYMMIHGRVKLHVTGIEKIPFGTQYLFVSNHRSKFDNMVHSVILKKQYMAYISKPENFDIPIASHYICRGMYLPIERNSPREAMKTIIKATDLLSKGFFSIAVFPEGTRSQDNTLLEYKPGCFKIAMKANAPIVVAVTQGTEKIHKNAPWRKSDVYFDILKVIMPDEYKEKTTVDICNEVYQLTKDHLEKFKKV